MVLNLEEEDDIVDRLGGYVLWLFSFIENNFWLFWFNKIVYGCFFIYIYGGSR